MIHRVDLSIPLLMLALLLVPAGASAAGDVRWRSFDEGLHEAAATGRPVLVDVFTDWCGWCKKMDRDVYTRADVRAYLAEHFVTVRFNAEGRAPATYEGRAYTGATLAQHFRINGYPTTVFLRADGGHLVNVPGYLEPAGFMVLLRYVAEGAMERGEDFDAFSRRAGAAH